MAGAVQDSKVDEGRPRGGISPVLRVALFLGIVVHLAGFLIFHVVTRPLPELGKTDPYVEYVSAGSLANDTKLEEQAVLFDSAPLFIPTRWNASQSLQVVERDEVRGNFPDFEPEMDLLSSLQPSSLPIVGNYEVSEPGDLLASHFWRFFTAFGESPDPVVGLPESSQMAQISVLTGVLADNLPERSFSMAAELDLEGVVGVVRPVTYYLRLSGAGSLGTPTLGQSSGSPSFDRAVNQWLMEPEVLARLPRGYLSITVFP